MRVWLQLNKERLHGTGKKIKDLQYVPFEVLEKVGDECLQTQSTPIHAHLLNSECG
jgi:hypothetical protein